MAGQPTRPAGFTLIEIVFVIAILGILASMAIPKFIDLREDAHHATAKATHGGFSSAVNIIHAAWLVRGSSPVGVSANGWPNGSGGPPMNNPACAAIWTDILTSPPPGTPGFVPGADGWGALGFFNFCYFIYQPDISPYRIIRYNALTGSVEYLVI
jgi:prepilin-type N-terminal cleavage/methylation domain-containing protein